jgi:hypothetical protein
MLSGIFRWSILASCAVLFAKGGVILTLNQVGPDVVLNGSGTANLAALTAEQSGGCQAALNFGQIIAGALGGCKLYGNLSGPTSFPTSGAAGAMTSSGAIVGFEDYFGTFLIIVPDVYVSGAALGGTATFSGTTLSAITTPGTYVWTWGSGATADSLTLLIGAPEPSTILPVAGALLGIMVFRNRLRPATRARC